MPNNKMIVNLDMNKNQLQNAVIHNLTEAPSDPVSGQQYFNTTDNTLYYYDGTTWIKLLDLSSNKINGTPLSTQSGYFYAVSDTAAATVQKVVSIPSITALEAGLMIIVQPTVTSSVANSTLKLNDFDAYPMRYNGSAITTSTDSIVWNSAYPSIWVFNGTYWVFVAHGVDSNTTYTLNYSLDSGSYIAGIGSYAITRYSIIAQKPDMTWEKITDTSASYTTATTKTVNTNGFLLNQLRYYGTTTTLANGAKAASNVVYEKAASINFSYSSNCSATPGWTTGKYVYLVGAMGNDNLFYFDETNWWTTNLPVTNDGKLYIRIGLTLTTTDATISFFEDRPIFYHNGTKLCEYLVADNKQDTLGYTPANDSNVVHTTGNESIAGTKTFTTKITSPIIETGSAASNYFQSQKFRGEGNANTYYHAVDFGYKNHDQVDFYEYGGKFVFHKHTGAAIDSGDTILGQINSNGWEGNVKGNVTGNLTGTASKATADASGNTITTTYSTKSETVTAVSVSGNSISVTKNGSTTTTALPGLSYEVVTI